MPKRLRRRVEAVRAMTEPLGWPAAPAVDAEVLTAVAQACRDRVCLDFDYVAADGAASHRHTEPHRLVPVGRRWYLVAYDRTRHDWRSYRLDRLRRPVAGAPFGPRRLPARDAAEYVKAGLARAPQPHTVRAEVAAPAERVLERVGRWVEVSEEGDTCCQVTVRAESPEWALIALVATGAEFRVLDPPRFADYLREVGGRLAAAVS